MIFSASQKRALGERQVEADGVAGDLVLEAAELSLNFLVCMLHTGVSSDGTTLNRRALAGVLPA